MGPQKRRTAVAEGGDVGSDGSRQEEELEEKVVKEEDGEEVEEEEEEEEREEEEMEVDGEEGEADVKVEEGDTEVERQQKKRPREDENFAAEVRGDGEGESSSPSATTTADDNDYILVKLADIRKEVQCPICLGIIKKTRTVMECLHRFCRDCIDKSMRLGNNECPACRTHCASRRSLRDDPNYDSLIAALYPDIEKYEEEELTFHEEEKNRNKKIQLSIAAILRRQAEALGGKRRVTRNTPRGRTRNFMNFRGGLDDDDAINANDWERDSTPADESCVDVRPKRYKRSSSRPSRSMVASDADEGCDGNDDGERETRSASPGRTGNREVLVWGKGGTRSQTRHGGINGKNTKGNRITKIVDYLHSYAENDELDVHLTLLPLGDHPKLDRPHLCCRPSLTVQHICELVATQTSMKAKQIEILARKPHGVSPSTRLNPTSLPCKLAPSEDEYQILGAHESVDGLCTCFASSLGNLDLVYRLKISG